MKFRKKPEVVEAVQWNGENRKEIISFMGGDPILSPIQDGNKLHMPTSTGSREALPGDWIVKRPYADTLGFDFVPCTPSNLLKHCEVCDQEFHGICGCCGFKDVPVKLMPKEKAYICNVCLVEKTPQQRQEQYHKNLGIEP